jgi:hypothetical protein
LLRHLSLVAALAAPLPHGPAKLDPSDNTLLIVPFTAPLPDGKYTVDWQAVGPMATRQRATTASTRCNKPAADALIVGQREFC